MSEVGKAPQSELFMKRASSRALPKSLTTREDIRFNIESGWHSQIYGWVNCAVFSVYGLLANSSPSRDSAI